MGPPMPKAPLVSPRAAAQGDGREGVVEVVVTDSGRAGARPRAGGRHRQSGVLA